MRVINDHQCKDLAVQNCNDEEEMAVQEMVLDTEHGVDYNGWYLVFYGKETDVAFGIKYCPYCGKLLRS